MKNFVFTLIPCLLAVATVRGADPQELVDLRQKYLEALGGIREPIRDKYLNTMEELLTEYTKEGNLEKALEVRSAIKVLKNAPSGGTSPPVASNPGGGETDPSPPSAPPTGATVTLSASRATLEGALKLYRGSIVNWIRPNCRARWHDRTVPAGKYDVYFVYSGGYGQGGTVEVRDFNYSFDVRVGQTRLRLERIKVGTLETRGGISMQITAKSTTKSGIMNLREVQLVPSS